MRCTQRGAHAQHHIHISKPLWQPSDGEEAAVGYISCSGLVPRSIRCVGVKDFKLYIPSSVANIYMQSCKQSYHQTFSNWCLDLTGLLLSLSGAVFLSSNKAPPPATTTLLSPANAICPIRMWVTLVVLSGWQHSCQLQSYSCLNVAWNFTSASNCVVKPATVTYLLPKLVLCICISVVNAFNCPFTVLAPSVMATVSCVANVLLVVIVVVVSVKCHHLRHQGQCEMCKRPITTIHMQLQGRSIPMCMHGTSRVHKLIWALCNVVTLPCALTWQCYAQHYTLTMLMYNISITTYY